jgi:hypothetical protein
LSIREAGDFHLPPLGYGRLKKLFSDYSFTAQNIAIDRRKSVDTALALVIFPYRLKSTN